MCLASGCDYRVSSANANVQLAKESIVHVAGNAFVKDAYTPSMSPVGYSSIESGNMGKRPFCNSNIGCKTDEEHIKDTRSGWRQMMLLRFVDWLVSFYMKVKVCSRITRRQCRFTIGQQRSVLVRRIVSWETIIMKVEI